MMGETSAMLGEINRLCAEFATALQRSELQLYATIALVIVLSMLLFPRKDDPDQI